MAHFVDCVANGTEAIESGLDGRAALEVVYAAYLSAGRGAQVRLPLELSEADAARSPYLLWRDLATGTRRSGARPGSQAGEQRGE